MNISYLGLGSNLGNREQYLELALSYLSHVNGLDIMIVSSHYQTKAVSSFPQPDFINMVAKISTILTPTELLDTTESIEIRLGRASKGTGDPRTIDIDILLYNQEIISMDRLIVPHPMMHERLFVLEPMVEIEPKCMHPLFNTSMEILKMGCYVR